uniref:Uncharacterized protein n=1 Tax=Amphimedon queenslandica TaxID=400682 RepID=A0A1X7TVF9_AMPQE
MLIKFLTCNDIQPSVFSLHLLVSITG